MPPSQAMQYVHPGFSHSCALQTSRSLFLCRVPSITLHLHHTHIQTALLPAITPTHPLPYCPPSHPHCPTALHHTHTALLPSITPTHKLPYLKIFCADRMACSTPFSASDSGTDRAYLKYSSYRQVFKSGSNSMHL
jgi:hypothetical protein